MFPLGTVPGSPRGIAVSQGTTRIRFAAPGEVSPSRRAPARETDVTHTSTFGFAYANEVARESMFSKGHSKFPTGSIIVREKLLTPAASNAEILVVMVKRGKGFNSKASDWEFLTISGDTKKIEKREQEGKCQKCHASEAKNDFVFRYPAP